MKCTKCKSSKRQVKNGLNKSGSQKYLCRECSTVYTPEPNEMGILPKRVCSPSGCMGKAVGMVRSDGCWRSIHKVSPTGWVPILPNARVAEKVKNAELDELFTVVGKKKTRSTYVLTIVDRETRYVLSWDVVQERTSEALQACLERGPQARQYHSNAFPAYDSPHGYSNHPHRS